MKIRYRKGNLLDLFDKGEFDCIAHQCNIILLSESCGGIAKAIFGKYYRASQQNNSRLLEKISRVDLLGDISIGEKAGFSNYIFNLYAQCNPGPPSKGIDSLECRLSYLRECLHKVRNVMMMNCYTTLGIPLIASGLAKGNLNLTDREYFNKTILPVIKKVFIDTNIEITVVHLK